MTSSDVKQQNQDYLTPSSGNEVCFSEIIILVELCLL